MIICADTYICTSFNIIRRVFDISIDDYEEKKWRRPGADISDFFNYGLDEEKWKDYCKQLASPYNLVFFYL